MSIFLLIVFIISIAYLITISAYGIGWYLIKTYHITGKQLSTKISVIIAARNEEEHIADCLNDIIDQDYPRDLFEVIVIDDNSTDKTSEIVKAKIQETKEKTQDFIIRYLLHNLTPNPSPDLTPNPSPKGEGNANGNGNKKRAIALGISKAEGNLIITTDADCRMGKKWLSTIADYYENKKPKMIIGPVSFHKDDTIFKQLQSLEFISLIGSTAGSAKLKIPIMCNGANLAYEKSSYYEVGGFSKNLQFVSGDDVFLMNSINKRYPGKVQFLKNTDAIVNTEAAESLNSLISQRIRWVSKTKGYLDKTVDQEQNQDKVNKKNILEQEVIIQQKAINNNTSSRNFNIIIVALVVYLFNLSLLVLLISGIFYHHLLFIFVSLFICKTLIDLPILSGITDFMNRRKLMRYMIPLEFINIFYVSAIGFVGNFGRFNWKGRKY